MNLPFFWVVVGLVLGITVEPYVRSPTVWLFACLGTGLILLWFLRGRRIFMLTFVLLMAVIGILCNRWDRHVPLQAIQNYAGSGRVVVTGVVDSLPEVKTHGKKVVASLVLSSRSVMKWEKGRRQKFQTTGDIQVFLLLPPFVPKVGDELRLFGTLQLPRRALNPGEFNYSEFLKAQNIHVTFQCIGKRSVKTLYEGHRFAPKRLLAQARQNLADRLDKLYALADAAILKALALGLRSAVSSDVRDHFMKTGTIHLVTTADTKWNYTPFSNAIAAAHSA